MRTKQEKRTVRDREDLEFIKKFSMITVAEGCRKFGYDQSNLMNNRYSGDRERNVRKYIESELAKIYLEESEKYLCQEK